MHANPMLHDGAWVGADNSSLQGSPPHAEFCAIITCTLLDCILYLMQYPYDPGTLLSSANYCTPGKVYLYPIYQGLITCILDSSSEQLTRGPWAPVETPSTCHPQPEPSGSS